MQPAKLAVPALALLLCGFAAGPVATDPAPQLAAFDRDGFNATQRDEALSLSPQAAAMLSRLAGSR